MISIKKVNKYFNNKKVHAIDNTSLNMDKTGLVALLGPSGCGKTTLLNVIGGLDKVSSGSIYINGKKITSKFANKVDKIRNNNIGYIFQDYKLIENYTVYDNIAIVLKMLGVKDKKEIKERVEYVLDKVGMLRYKRRPASMLSGGERQRVGIARAIIKNPDIILADEPTGNLDSKNTLEVMNIIKSISKTKLVILVTHEVSLAKFYASRIVEIKDGQVVNDYENIHDDDLDYSADNEFYLKDFNNYKSYKYDNLDINVYSNETTNTKVDIVIKNGNIYIQSNKDNVEVVDNHSSITFVDDHYKKLNKNDVDKYEFDLTKLEISKKKYSSIMNLFQILKYGLSKVLDYSFIKKLLLAGFFAAASMIVVAASMYIRSITVNDSDFIKYNSNYLMVEKRKIKIDELEKIEKMESVVYAIPGNSLVSFDFIFDKYYQSVDSNLKITGSITDTSLLKNEDLIAGRMPQNDREIVIDKAIYKADVEFANGLLNIGIKNMDELVNYDFSIDKLGKFKVVGISDTNSPSIYLSKDNFTNIIYLSRENEDGGSLDIYDYKLFDNFVIKKGRLPENDYEVMVNIDHIYEYELNKKIDHIKVNNQALKVVGYYSTTENYDYYLVNNNMVKSLNYNNLKGLMVISTDDEDTIDEFSNLHMELKDSYEVTKNAYVKSRKSSVKSTMVVCAVILIISVIEIFLIIRSSFLSRIKEIGIYRAIGVKKLDIYKMFYGEIFAITTLGSLPGILLSSFIVSNLTDIKILSTIFIMNKEIVIGSIIFIYLFNMIVGLLPVFNVTRKRPAEILSRIDID